jgi:hypothetical protein
MTSTIHDLDTALGFTIPQRHARGRLARLGPALDLILGADPDPDSNDNLPEDFLTNPPGFGQRPTPEEHAFPPLFGLAEASVTPEDDAAVSAEPAMEPAEIEQALEPVVPQTYVPTPVRGTISIGTPDGHLRRRLELDPENYDLRRQLGEALLDTGDRDGGLQELELAMVGFELGGDLDRAQEVVDEILRVQPASVLHHQKRVEYAVRSRDRGRLTSSYLELADALFRELVKRAEGLGGGAYGMEALNVLRIEKGHITHSEIHGRTTAFDIGMQRMISGKKDCIGKTMAAREGLMEGERERMVGLMPMHPEDGLTAGAHLFNAEAAVVAATDQGYVTSVGFSPTLGHSIGLGFVKNGPKRHGEVMRLVDHLRGVDIPVRICPPVFVDPDGGRLRD